MKKTTVIVANMIFYSILMSCSEKNANPKEFTVFFNSNEGSEVQPQTVKEGEKIIRPDDPIFNGYEFSGWYKETAFTNDWEFNTDIVIADMTLYAKWTSVIDSNIYTVPYYGVSWDELKGTKWKLYSIDHNDRGRKFLEPTDCDTCYTFTIDKETGWLSGISIQNKVNIKITFLDHTRFFNIEIVGSELNEPYDGNLYCNTLKIVNLIDFDTRYFGLHFNDCGSVNCNGTMIFNRIDP